MRVLGRRPALGAIGMVLAGCVPEQKVVTQSNAAAVSGQKLTRVLIGIRVRMPVMTNAQYEALLRPSELKQAFEAKWPPLGIAIEVVEADGAPENGAPALLAAANDRFQAYQMLLLQTSHVRGRGVYVQEYQIDARLYDGAAKKVIWRAATELPDFGRASGSQSKRREAADLYVDNLTAKLREDGLIR